MITTIEEGSLTCHVRSHATDPLTGKSVLIGREECLRREDEVEVELAEDVDPAEFFATPGISRCAVCFA